MTGPRFALLLDDVDGEIPEGALHGFVDIGGGMISANPFERNFSMLQKTLSLRASSRRIRGIIAFRRRVAMDLESTEPNTRLASALP